MVIVFYDTQENNLYICSKNQKMISVPMNDPDILSFIPNDDILYVQNGHILTKSQLGDWISGNYEISTTSNFPTNETVDEEPDFDPHDKKGLYIHPKHNGTILIQDMPKSNMFPEGILRLNGKRDFKSIQALGGMEILEESVQFKILLAKGKIEVVDYGFMKKHSGKRQVSLADAALDAIIIKNDARGSAESVASSGGISSEVQYQTSGSDVIEINVD